MPSSIKSDLHSLLKLAGLAVACSMYAAAQQPPSSLLQLYSQREQTAPDGIESELTSFRQTLGEKKLTFQVGYTKALDTSLERLAGTRIPSNLREIAERQNSIAQRELLRRGPRASPGACSAANPAFNWPDSGKVSAVQDQDGCGSCWAFSAIGSYESSYLIHNSWQNGVSQTVRAMEPV
jgi:cathepsin L